MKAFEIADLVRSVPEMRGTEPFWVLRGGRPIGTFTPLAACRRLSEPRRRELWKAVAAVEGLPEDGIRPTDEEIVRLLEAAGRAPAP